MGIVFKKLAASTLNKETQYFPDRLVIEECENIHLHYRNLRLEFSVDEFYQFGETIYKAIREMQYKYETKNLPIDKINPYDRTHAKGFENTDKDHREGIEAVKKLIKAGKKILPILVRKTDNGYQRMDGFKRYFAFKELGHKEINCYVSRTARVGGQDGKKWLL